MNPTINLFNDIAELCIYQNQTRNNSDSNQDKSRILTKYNYDGAVTKFDRMLNSLFSTNTNDEIEPIINAIEDELLDTFSGLLELDDTFSKLTDTQKKINVVKKLKEVKNIIKQYDGLDINIKGYKHEHAEANDLIEQKIEFTDPETKNVISKIELTNAEEESYDIFISTYIWVIVCNFGRKVLQSLGKQMMNTDVATFSIFDSVSRQMIYNPYSRISNWICAMKYVSPTYLPVIGGYLLNDNRLTLSTLYTLLVTAQLPQKIIDLYEFIRSNGEVANPEDDVLDGPFLKREINDNGRITITFIAPSGLEVKRMLIIRHRVQRKRQLRDNTRNLKYRDLVRNFGKRHETILDE